MVVQSVRGGASSLAGTVQGYVDRIAPPETRQQVWSKLQNFAAEQPILASFLFVQAALAAIPVLLFGSFALATLVVSLLAAVAFSLFWIGAAALVLVPTLFVAFSAGVCLWLWAIGNYIALRFTYNVLSAALGPAKVPEIRAEVKTDRGVTSVSTVNARDGSAPKVERTYEPNGLEKVAAPLHDSFPRESPRVAVDSF
ncbi:MAG: hypothetical protein M1832_006242 [Thelocarpon impressellum]|nr:MAG: hypothetical protein M1832_006242 [Thelocarpon impressellum]